VRAVLASVYRQTGNAVEAGRWGFLTDDVRPTELNAFAKANPDPWQRLRLLHFSGDPVGLPDGATERLVRLAEEAQASGPPTPSAGDYRVPPEPHGTAWPCLFTVVVLSTVTVLAGVGVMKIIAWLVE
jgi:Family of unknown function (DUF6584)